MELTKKKIKIPIYFGDLILIQTDDFDALPEKYGIGRLKPYDAVAFEHIKKNGYIRYFIVVRTKCKPRTVAHEVVHIVNSILKDKGIQLDYDNDEAQAYLTGWIIHQCYKYFKINQKSYGSSKNK